MLQYIKNRLMILHLLNRKKNLRRSAPKELMIIGEMEKDPVRQAEVILGLKNSPLREYISNKARKAKK